MALLRGAIFILPYYCLPSTTSPTSTEWGFVLSLQANTQFLNATVVTVCVALSGMDAWLGEMKGETRLDLSPALMVESG